MRPRHAVRSLLLAAAFASGPACAEDDFWWWIRGFEITPGAGLRHFAVEVTRGSDGATGNSSNSIGNSLFGSLMVESPSWQFGGSNWGASVYFYASNVGLDEQFVNDPGQGAGDAGASGSRKNVGTSMSGYYSYLVPALHYRVQRDDGSQFKVALGYGRWHGEFSGDIILTPDNRPQTGQPKTQIDTSVSKNAYLASMQYKFAKHWQAFMSVGGPRWSDSTFKYQMEEVSIVIGYTFRL